MTAKLVFLLIVVGFHDILAGSTHVLENPQSNSDNFGIKDSAGSRHIKPLTSFSSKGKENLSLSSFPHYPYMGDDLMKDQRTLLLWPLILKLKKRVALLEIAVAALNDVVTTTAAPPTTITDPPTTPATTEPAPTTDSPTTNVPTTNAPTTNVPTTNAPTTNAPTTNAPTTIAPTTNAPTTNAPTTNAPTTNAPTTNAPTTNAPTTNAPTTNAPTTNAPTTNAPTTNAPTTNAPTPTAFIRQFDESGETEEKSMEEDIKNKNVNIQGFTHFINHAWFPPNRTK